MKKFRRSIIGTILVYCLTVLVVAVAFYMPSLQVGGMNVLPTVHQVQAATSGQTVFYLQSEPAEANATYNGMSLHLPENDTATAGTNARVTANAVAAAPCEGTSMDPGDNQTVVNVDSPASGTWNCVETFFSQPVGQTINLSATNDTNSLYANIWMNLSGSGNNAKASTTVTWFRFDGSAYEGFATTTLANTGFTSTAAPYGAFSTPAKDITFAATDRLVVKVLLRVGTQDSSTSTDNANVYFDRTSQYSFVRWLYTVSTPSKPTLTSTHDDDFTTAAVQTDCSAGGVAYNVKWTCLSPAGVAGNFTAGGPTSGHASSSDWLIIEDKEDAAPLGPNFSANPENTYIYQTVDTNTDGNGDVTTVVASVGENIAGTSPYYHAGLVLWASDTDYLLIEAGYDGTNRGVWLNNSGSLSNSTGIAGAYQRVWLRWKKTDSSYQAYYSTDGSSFSTLGSPITHATTFTRTGLSVYSAAINTNYSAAFEYFDYALLPTISGTAYASLGGDPLTTKSVKAYKNGSTLLGTATTDGATGAWSMAVDITSGDIVTLYIEGDAANANLIWKSDAVSKSDMDLYGGVLIVRSDNSSAITNANLATARVGAAPASDMVYMSVTNNLTTSSTVNILVQNGSQSTDYDPGGTITTSGSGYFRAATSTRAYIDTAASVIDGDVIAGDGAEVYIDANTAVNGGDIKADGTAKTGNILYSGGFTPTLTLSGTGSIYDGNATSTFYALTTSGTGVTTIASTVVVNNAVSIGANTAVDGTGSLTVNAGMTGTGALNLTGGTLTMGGTGNLGGSSSWTINNLTTSAGTITQTNKLDVNGNVSISAGTTFAASGTYKLKVAGNFANLSAADRFVHNNGTVLFDGTSQTISGATNFYNFSATTTLQTLSFEAATTTKVSGAFTVAGSGAGNVTLNSATPGNQWLLYAAGTASVDYTDVTDGGCNASSITITVVHGTGNNEGTCWSFASAGKAKLYGANSVYEYNASATAAPTYNIKANNGTAISDTNDIRLIIAPQAPVVWDTTQLTATVTGGAQARVSTTVSYPDSKTLLLDVTTTFDSGMSAEISGMKFTSFSSALSASSTAVQAFIDGAGDTVADATPTSTMAIKGLGSMGAATYVTANELDGAGTSITGKTLHSFTLTQSAAENVSVTGVVFRITSLYGGLVTGDFSSLALYTDTNNDGLIASETQVGGAGTPSISGSTGTITFSSAFTVSAATPYILIGTISNLTGEGQGFQIALATSDVTAAGVTSAQAITLTGSSSASSHSKANNYGGGIPTGGGAGGSSTPVSGGVQGGSVAGWYGNQWLYRKKLSIDYTKVVSSSENFPVLVYFATDSDLAARARSDTFDILFTGSDGTTKLAHQVEKFTSASGALAAWVKIPSLSATANTSFYMYYGNSSAGDQSNAAGVWDANYKGVWHFPNGTSLAVDDSTGTHNGTNSGATAGIGEIDGGAVFGGTKYVDFTAIPLATTFTKSFWMNSSDNAQTGMIFGENDSFSGKFGLVGGLFFWRTASAATDNSIALPSQGAWHYINLRRNSSNVVSITIDNGAPTNMFTGAAQAYTMNPETIGASCGASGDMPGYQSFTGSEDEFRISDISRSNGWIQTEYNNQSSPAAFYAAIGSQEANPDGGGSGGGSAVGGGGSSGGAGGTPTP